MLAPLALFPLVLHPRLGLGVVLIVVVVLLGARSISYPVALSALPSIVIGLVGANPLPAHGVVLFIGAWIALAVLFDRASDREQQLSLPFVAPAVLTVAFTVWMVVRLGGAPVEARGYGSQKLQLFVISSVLMLLAGLLIGRRRRHFDLYVLLTLLMAVLSAAAIARGLASGSAQASVGGRFALEQRGSPIGLGRDAARGLVLAAFILLVGGSVRRRAFALAAIPLLAVPFLAAGSRGPAVGLVVGGVVLFVLILQDPRSRRRVVLVAGGAVLATLLVAQLVPGANVQRTLSVLVGGPTGADTAFSSNGRTALWSDAWQGFASHPFSGLGTGGYASLNPVQLYPHNILLETASELGSVGLLLLVATLCFGVYALVRARRAGNPDDRRHAALVGALFAAAFTNAFFSADLANNEAVWLAVGLAGGLAARSSVLAARPRLRGRRFPVRTIVRRPAHAEQRHPELPPPGIVRSAGAIVAPAGGSTVSGPILVEARPADTGWGVQSLTVEFRAQGSEWGEVAVVRDDGYDLLGGEGGQRLHVAVVRTRAAAELVGEALRPLLADVEIQASRRRPWRGGPARTAVWDATELDPGAYQLRAVTVDVAGARTESAAATVEVVPAAARPIPVSAAELAELAEREQELHRRTEIADARTRALAAREAALARRAAELGARESALGVRERQVADRETEVMRNAEVAERRSRVVGDREGELVRRAAQLAQREGALEQERRAVTAARPAAPPTQPLREEAEAHAAPPAEPEPAPQPPAPEPPTVEVALALSPAAAPEGPSEPAPPLRVGSPSAQRLWELEALAREHPDPDEYVQAEREALLYTLRSYAHPDGSLPPEFHGLVEDAFGDLLA